MKSSWNCLELYSQLHNGINKSIYKSMLLSMLRCTSITLCISIDSYPLGVAKGLEEPAIVDLHCLFN